ncbi:hypothetical protein RHGRI_013459 [Rhododendron griersonianum]|uniref:Uncharacterized protein n=1 Tax=Rhododendron griersonianum TaxID=479676 RepID=A0AAV6K5Y4_9ERIC|nr:hypothetical protein RHGRI_013459 [Rhododendron griersonianum]
MDERLLWKISFSLHFWATEAIFGFWPVTLIHLADGLSSSPTATVKACAADSAPIFRVSMLVLPACRVAVFGFWVFLVLAANCCCGENGTVEVVGGLHVTIECKSENGKLKTRGGGELDQEGKFRVNLPSYDEIAEDGGEKLNEDCFAQLHSASGAPCAIQNHQKDSKVVLKSEANGKQVFGLNGNLKISPITCTSAFLWPYFKYPPLLKFPFCSPPPLPPQLLPPSRPVHTNPPPPQPEASPPPPPSPVYNYPPPPAVPVYNNPPPTEPKGSPRPQPPPVPQPQPLPPPPIYNPPPPSPAPVYNNPPSAQPKASPPPVPVHNKPAPTPSPVYIEPIPPATPSPGYGQILPPPSPVYKKPIPPPAVPVYTKPLPPPPTQKPKFTKPLLPPKPVIEKPLPPLASPHKSFPHIPKAPPIPQLPPIPTNPRRFFNKPTVGLKSPLPPSPSHA